MELHARFVCVLVVECVVRPDLPAQSIMQILQVGIYLFNFYHPLTCINLPLPIAFSFNLPHRIHYITALCIHLYIIFPLFSPCFHPLFLFLL